MSLPQFLIPSVVSIFVAGFAIWYLAHYARPSARIARILQQVIPRLRQLKSSAKMGEPVDREMVSRIMLEGDKTNTLSHLWAEYTETLHEQYDHIDGERRLVAIRATVPAEVFFNTQVLVDTPLNTEFFRHLPGILTSIGIIGTFSGLILGLSGFEPTGSAETVKASLGGLMEGVMEAFIASATAIGMALIITLDEKRELNRRYKQVEELTQAIDALYEAGAGEEYLSRLVTAAEQNAVHTAQLKQSLVDDLKQILTDLTERQIQASQQQSKEIATDVGTSIKTSLETPLRQIAEVVERASGQQGTAVQNMLEDLLAAFMAKMEDTFGGQISGLNNMMSQSVEAMREMQTEFGKLVGDLRQTGQTSTDEMARKLAQMLEQAESRQVALETRMGEFLVSIRKSMGDTQTETQQQLADMLHATQMQMQKMVVALEEQRGKDAENAGVRDKALGDATGALVEGVKSEVERLVREVAAATAAMEKNISVLQSISTSAIERMNSGAETMYLAASEFKDAGKSVTGAMQSGTDTMSRLKDAAALVGDASSKLHDVLADNQRARDSLSQMTTALQGVIEAARRDAGLSKQLVDDLEQAARQLSAVQLQAGAYFEGVNEALKTAFSAFGDAVKRELGKSNAVFQSELGTGTDLLKAAFTELAAVISQFQSRP